MSNAIFEKFNGMSDEEFVELLIRADREPIIDGIKMPGFPDIEFQKNSVGSRGAEDLKYEAYSFIRLVKEYMAKYGIEIHKETKILDFGVGWGRMIRFFFKDMPSDNIFGIDAWAFMIEKCKEILPAGNYFISNPCPPVDFDDNVFDVIYAYSVFSHLRADAAELWIKEFSRILKPNGLVVATTEGEHFLDFCETLQNNPEQLKEHYWYSLIAKAFQPIETFRKKYADGEFLYVPTLEESLPGSFYGDAVIPEAYIKGVFGKYLMFRDFNQGENRSQAVFVLQNNKSFINGEVFYG